MKRNLLAIPLTLLLTIALASPTQATILNGAPCKVAGAIDGQLTQDNTVQDLDFTLYICSKVKSKLVWKPVKDSKSAYSQSGTNYKKLITSRAATIYPGQGKKCVVDDCPIGSVGPGGGIVFYDAGSLKPWGRYLEVAPIGWTGRGNEDITSVWCSEVGGGPLNPRENINSDSKVIPRAGNSIGSGKALTSKLLDKCPFGAALPVTNYLGGNTADWFLPSADELNELCKYSFGQLKTTVDVMCDSVGTPKGGFAENAYWSSSQANQKGIPTPVAYISNFFSNKVFGENGTYFVEPLVNERAIRPIRAFGSPSEKLADAGVIQLAGVGESGWPVKCPVVIDSQKSPQPQVTAINFNADDSMFLRLKDNSSSAVTTSSNIVGCYANFGQLENGGDFYSVGSINRDKNGYFWQNGGGDTVGGRIRLTLNGSILTATTGEPQTISLIK
jgi:hypothetical protein